MNKKQKRLRKEEFFKNKLPTLEKYYTIKRFEHFIKIELGDHIYDYYPGGGRINKIVNGVHNWSDMNPDLFYQYLLKKIRKNT